MSKYVEICLNISQVVKNLYKFAGTNGKLRVHKLYSNQKLRVYKVYSIRRPDIIQTYNKRKLKTKQPMMDGFSFDEEKAVNVVLFILEKLGEVTRHKLAKILYFADQKHLVQYGRPILGDTYIKMPYGPVPSAVYDGIKFANSNPVEYELFNQSIKTVGKSKIIPKKSPDMDDLSESEVQCLNESIQENESLSFDELISKSHSLAWNSASKNGNISITNIAKEGGATSGMVNHILDNIHDLELSRQYGLLR